MTEPTKTEMAKQPADETTTKQPAGETGGHPSHDPDRLLAIYLQDHMAAARGGHALACRLRDQNRDRWFGPELAALEREIAEDVTALRSMLGRLGVEEHKVKQWAVMLGERVARIKLNGRLTGYSPSSRVIELEALASGIEGKEGLWRALRVAAERRSELHPDELDRLHERAVDQRHRVEAIHANAVEEAFLGTRPAPPAPANVPSEGRQEHDMARADVANGERPLGQG
jgi:hypothetical protein